MQNQFDTMGRLSVVRQDLIRDGQPSYIEWANNAVYGPAGQLTALSWVVQQGTNRTTDPDIYINEGRTYNSRLQLTGLTTNGSFTQAAMSFTYNYSATANNGQITSMTNNVSGETVTYAYDALKRLISPSTNTGTWGQSFAYDGFGNMLNQTVTQGSAPSLALAYDNSTNRISTAGYGYDANGNMTASPAFGATYTYDASNRLVTAFSSNGTENYGYAPDNKRMYKKLASGEEQVHFYSGNQRLGIYKFQTDGGGVWSFATVSTQKYFGGRKLETMDRLGSDVRNTKYFPYGAEATVTANEKNKFGTYFRDTASNLDYADQRYYSSGIGRFMSPDPYTASGGAGDPGSWNRYAYVQGDPTNSKDTKGLYREEVSGIDDWWGDPFDGLGSNDGSDGWRGSRRLACLSGFCRSTDGSCEISGQRYAPGDPTCVAFFPLAGALIDKTNEPSCEMMEIAYIGTYLSQRRSPLAAYASAIVAFSQIQGLDDRFIVALAGIESTYGTKQNPNGSGQYNAFSNGAHCAALGVNAYCKKVDPYFSYGQAIYGVIELIGSGRAYADYSSTHDIYSIYERGNINVTSGGQGLLDQIYGVQLHGDVTNVRKPRCPYRQQESVKCAGVSLLMLCI